MKHHNYIHGGKANGKSTYLYNTWRGMKIRCYKENHKFYHRYGGRGIKMFPLWVNSFPLFKSYILDNLGKRPKGYTLDRIDNNGNYEPGNLRWATQKEQCKNKDVADLYNKKLKVEDILEIKWLLSLGRHSQREIAKEYGVTDALISMIKLGKTRKYLK